MPDFLTTGGAGAGGSVLGVLVAFFGFKSKFQDMDKRIDRLSNSVTYKDTCIATHKGVERQLKAQTKLLESILEKLP